MDSFTTKYDDDVNDNAWGLGYLLPLEDRNKILINLLVSRLVVYLLRMITKRNLKHGRRIFVDFD